MRLPSHDRPTPALPAALDRCPRLVGREFSGTRGRRRSEQAAIPLHQNGGRHLRPHRPQRSRHWISRAWCGRLRRYRAGDRPQYRPPSGKPLDRNGVISGSDNADGADGRAPTDGTGSACRNVLPRCRPCAGRLPPGAAGPRGHGRVPWSPDPKRQFTSDCPSKSVPVNDLGQMAN